MGKYTGKVLTVKAVQDDKTARLREEIEEMIVIIAEPVDAQYASDLEGLNDVQIS